MNKRYFQRVAHLSPTRLWINNPTREQADWALAEGAVGCTTNPSFSQKILEHPAEGAHARALLARASGEAHSPAHAAIRFQELLVGPIAEKFRPLYTGNSGRNGFVSLQGDPINDEEPDGIIAEALAARRLGNNIACKVPVTTAGLAAVEALVAQDVPINATEIFGVSQAVAVCEAYLRASRRSGKAPTLFLSHIAGIFDDYLGHYAREHAVDIAPDVLWQAGLAAARRVYTVVQARGYPCVFVSGGSRGLHHFTELVGGDMCITINWEGTADRLLAQDPPVVWRLFNPVPPAILEELLEKLPDFRRAYADDGLSVEEFADFGPVQLFRNSFVKSWQKVLDTIEAHELVK